MSATAFQLQRSSETSTPVEQDARAVAQDASGAVWAERERISRELHDTVVQTLVALRSELQQLAGNPSAPAEIQAGVTRAGVLVDHGLAELTRTIRGLRPDLLEGRDLASAIASELARIAGATGLQYEFSSSGDPLPLPPNVEDGLLRIAQEAIQNVRRHATAGRITVRLVFDGRGNMVCLVVEDDGRGFDRRSPHAGGIGEPQSDPDAPALLGAGESGDGENPQDGLDGFGLQGMQERARLMGGSFHISTGRGLGTRTEVEVPLGPVAGQVALPLRGGASRVERPIRVVIADDHPLARAGVARLLEGSPGIEVVAEAADGGAAIDTVRMLRPDVLLLDLQMGEIDGLQVLAGLQQSTMQRKPAVVVLTTYDQDEKLLAALRAGARGYVLKQAEGAEIARAVRAAAEGKAELTPSVAARLIDYVAGTPAPPAEEALTQRETEVLQALARGRTTKQIASDFELSPGTVKSHLEHIYQKLGVVGQGRVAALAVARERHLI